MSQSQPVSNGVSAVNKLLNAKPINSSLTRITTFLELMSTYFCPWKSANPELCTSRKPYISISVFYLMRLWLASISLPYYIVSNKFSCACVCVHVYTHVSCVSVSVYIHTYRAYIYIYIQT